MDSTLYFEQKKNMLKDCVTISENILSNISDIDKVNELLAARSEIIMQIQTLEDEVQGRMMMDTLPENQKSQINQLVSLLLGLDQDTTAKIKATQEELKQTMKVNTQSHKLINYGSNPAPTGGKLLDKKK